MAARNNFLGVLEYRLSPPFQLSVLRGWKTANEWSCFLLSATDDSWRTHMVPTSFRIISLNTNWHSGELLI